MRRIQIFLAGSLLVFSIFGLASGEIPHMMNFQGYLVDDEGPVTGRLEATFRIYDEPAGGEMLWQETDSISVENGLYSLSLGKINRIDISIDTDLWIGVQITGYPEMYPRYRQTSVPFTYVAEYSDSSGVVSDGSVATIKLASNAVTSGKIQNGTIQFADIGQNGASYGQVMKWYGSAWLAADDNDNADSDWQISGNNMWSGVSGNVGIGTSSPGGKLAVRGDILNVSSGGNVYGRMSNTTNGAGYISTYGPNGNSNIKLGNISGQGDYGNISVHGQGGAARGYMYVTTDGYGVLETRGANGNQNVLIDVPAGRANEGRILIMDPSGDSQAGIYINESGDGVVFGDVKYFRTPNPDRPGTDIWYASIEGPEAAAYIRGTAHLVEGMAEITLPDHFVAVASYQGITVQVSPLSADSKGLAVTEKSPEKIVVRELFNGNGSYDFDYTVTAVRKGYENYQVIRPAEEVERGRLDVSAD